MYLDPLTIFLCIACFLMIISLGDVSISKFMKKAKQCSYKQNKHAAISTQIHNFILGLILLFVSLTGNPAALVAALAFLIQYSRWRHVEYKLTRKEVLYDKQGNFLLRGKTSRIIL